MQQSGQEDIQYCQYNGWPLCGCMKSYMERNYDHGKESSAWQSQKHVEGSMITCLFESDQ